MFLKSRKYFSISFEAFAMCALIIKVITLYMKLPWFCHTNIRQLFCNCPRSRPLFGKKPVETCCHSVIASKWLETHLALCRTKILQLQHKHGLLRAWQLLSWKNNTSTFKESFHVIEGQVQLNGIIVIRPKSRPRFMQRNKNFMLFSGQFEVNSPC